MDYLQVGMFAEGPDNKLHSILSFLRHISRDTTIGHRAYSEVNIAARFPSHMRPRHVYTGHTRTIPTDNTDQKCHALCLLGLVLDINFEVSPVTFHSNMPNRTNSRTTIPPKSYNLQLTPYQSTLLPSISHVACWEFRRWFGVAVVMSTSYRCPTVCFLLLVTVTPGDLTST
jgi:hypothetical protein